MYYVTKLPYMRKGRKDLSNKIEATLQGLALPVVTPSIVALSPIHHLRSLRDGPFSLFGC